MTADRDKRSPTAHKSKNQAAAQSRSGYNSTPERKKYRAELGKIATKKGSNSTTDNHHVKPVGKGGSKSGKTEKVAKGKNRGHGMGRAGSAKTKVKKRVTGKG